MRTNGSTMRRAVGSSGASLAYSGPILAQIAAASTIKPRLSVGVTLSTKCSRFASSATGGGAAAACSLSFLGGSPKRPRTVSIPRSNSVFSLIGAGLSWKSRIALESSGAASLWGGATGATGAGVLVRAGSVVPLGGAPCQRCNVRTETPVISATSLTLIPARSFSNARRFVGALIFVPIS